MKNKQSSRPINSKGNYNKVDIAKLYLQVRISASTIYIHFCGNMLKALGVSSYSYSFLRSFFSANI